MFAVVPSAAAAPSEVALCALAKSATSVAEALRPYLTAAASLPIGSLTAPHTIEKVASCASMYSALLRSDGALLLLETPPSGGGDGGGGGGARVSVLESGGEAVADVAAGASHIVYCTVSGRVYSCGYDNTYGQLGDGTVWSSSSGATNGAGEEQGTRAATATPELSAPRCIAGFGERAPADSSHGDSRGNEDVSAAALGSSTDCRVAIGLALPPSSLASSTAVATTTQMAHTATNASAPAWRRVPPPADRRIAQVACGANHTLLLTQSGCCVYACGTGKRGQLGGSRLLLVQPTFRAVPLLFGMDVAQVAAADAHSFVLLRNGLLYAFGDNSCGQLGLGHTSRVHRPTAVTLMDKDGGETSASLDPHAAAAAAVAGHRQLDDKAYLTLRAPYASKESTYYPLRVPRLKADAKAHPIAADEDRDSGAIFAATAKYSGGHHALEASSSSVKVVRVYPCVSWTLLETTSPGVWLSCGAPLTRGVPLTGVSTKAARIDGCGVLGRPLLHTKAEAYMFQPVHWAAALSGMRQNADVTTAGLTAAPAWARDDPHFFGNNLFGGSGAADAEPCTDPLQLPGARPVRRTSFDTSAGEDSDPRTPIATTAPVVGYRSSADSAISGSVPSLFHATKGTEKAILHASDTVVSPYPTSLLLSLLSASAGKAGHDGVATSILVQSGGISAVALEVRGDDVSDIHVVNSSPVPASVRRTGTAGSSGTAVLQVYSAHGVVVPLPSYALVM
ncbi:cyclin-e binding protein 1-like protein [Novymonas esmeraldas]|uniref:Cyclin-e binding protein 1-like protein n=1 Tax=Novymonas esmeraldas TaxID=1808958 RepID=A0AAW0F1F9_9TRYP